MKTILRILYGSYVLIGFITISLYWGDRWLPRNVGVAIVTVIVCVWLVCAYVFFRNLRLTLRQKIVGWSVVVTLIGIAFTHRLASYYFYHDNWRWVLWEILGLSMIAVSVLLAALLLDKGDFPASDDSFTVESETPDHVIHMNGTSESSSAAALLKSTGDRDVSLR